jgi:uncharacterized membrane protein YccC
VTSLQKSRTLIKSLKVAIGSGIAWDLGQTLHSPRPFADVLAVIVLMQGHAYGSLLNALQFLLGVVAGLILGLIAERFLQVAPPILAAVIFVSMLMGGWLKVSRQGFNNQIAVSPLLVLASGSAQNIDPPMGDGARWSGGGPGSRRLSGHQTRHGACARSITRSGAACSMTPSAR